MREKIARAICRAKLIRLTPNKLHSQPEFLPAVDDFWSHFLPEADAALKVITDEFAKHGITMELIE